MRFIDECTLTVRAGRGGNGCIAFRREKYVPFGGPAGGDGGRGGDVVFEGDGGKTSLLDLSHRTHLAADDGAPGQGKDCYGRGGQDITVRVPLGTRVWDVSNDQLLFEITAPGERHVAARGGRGGRGNKHFATSVDRAPRRAEPGGGGEERRLRLELSVMADVGLLGFPNVGKSTLVRSVSRARPKVADYPFTTLVPSLGVVGVNHADPEGRSSFVLADIPGLIPGASAGAGLGVQFLRHLERTRILLHLVTLDAAPEREPLEDYRVIREELGRYDERLASLPEIVALSKADLTDVHEGYAELRRRFAERGIELHLVSAVSHQGLEPLMRKLVTALDG
jgi:GTP-binding protein